MPDREAKLTPWQTLPGAKVSAGTQEARGGSRKAREYEVPHRARPDLAGSERWVNSVQRRSVCIAR